MKRTIWITSALALSLSVGIVSAQYYQGPPPQPQGGYAWETPPPEFAAAQQRGYLDGVEGAKKDFKNHRPPNVNNRDEYRNPHFVSPPDRRDYRIGFRRGYEVAVHNMYGPGY